MSPFAAFKKPSQHLILTAILSHNQVDFIGLHTSLIYTYITRPTCLNFPIEFWPR
ncbi:hypothetical protein HanXRQr2_Chr04g0165311 [Helianthus annuus]|uniref:Uncharacterized protein n=1 Tax=Helianthus annuus TaxID=4232 RepID=A0A9K3J7E2_HELAN|nr:hypothetical protein HanXRQr2_Chr04g0165311 [Helianthus annuus]KAJ0931216.1 hypothetical protein HanPSC8_Chr04g0159051 [Helianthus annuus]